MSERSENVIKARGVAKTIFLKSASNQPVSIAKFQNLVVDFKAKDGRKQYKNFLIYL